MRTDFDYLAELDGTSTEQAWIKERLETLSVRESYALAAAAMRHPPEDFVQSKPRIGLIWNFATWLINNSHRQRT